jgi:hypothetical protein
MNGSEAIKMRNAEALLIDEKFGALGGGSVLLSSGRAPLLAPSPLRTGLEGFPSSGSSTQKRPLEKRGRGLIQNEQGLLDTGLLPIRTAVENPPGVWEAAPTACAVVICFASFSGSSRGLELEHQ